MKRTFKICKSCTQEKHTEDFPLRGKHRLNTCAKCYNLRQADQYNKQYAEDPDFRRYQIEKIRRSQWKTRYNTTPEIVYAILAEQGNKCANESCRKEITLDPFEKVIPRGHLDHNH